MCTASTLCIGMSADTFPQSAGAHVFGSGKVDDDCACDREDGPNCHTKTQSATRAQPAACLCMTILLVTGRNAQSQVVCLARREGAEGKHQPFRWGGDVPAYYM